MKDAGHVRWLYRELPELVGQGIVPAEAADRLRQHYGDVESAGNVAKRWAIVLFSILGAALIGGGIILLLAHNWDDLSRPLRAVISILPLAVAAGLGAWGLWTERASTAWREGVGTFQTLAIGASIALVAQTYNLGGRFDEFMLTWALLALPIAYLLRATLPAILYLVGIVVWTGSVLFDHTNRGLWYFPLLAAALPFLWWTARPNRYHPRPILFAWVLAVTVCIGTGLAAERACGRMDLWPILYAGLFALLYLVGTRWWGEAPAFWQRPLQTVGALGGVGLALILSFHDSWSHLNWNTHDTDEAGAALQVATALLFPVAALGLWGWSWCRRVWGELAFGALAGLAAIGWLAAVYDLEIFAATLFNLYLIGLGLGTLVQGFRNRRLGPVNAGMAILALLILCRFFDSDLGFVLRGVAFIVIGIGFLATNVVLLRWKGEAR